MPFLSLKKISSKDERPMQAILDDALEFYQRKRFLSEANESYARLKESKREWQDELKERQDWNNTINDGQKEEKQ